MTSTTTEVNDHLFELINDHWGLSVKEVIRISGFPRQMVVPHLREMEGLNRIKHLDGRYVACK